MRNDLVNPNLFGNDAGEDEVPEVLNSYFLEKPEFGRFFDPQTRLAFVRSRKGTGKSALLRQALYRRQASGEGELLIYVKASDLVALQDIDFSSVDASVYGWQQRICSRINLELGGVLRLAFSDDRMTLVERAEVAGFRKRNLVSSLLDRLRVKGAGIEISRQRLEQGDSEVLLRRFVEKAEVTVWILVDDIDATFINTDSERLKVSSFFSACRNLTSNASGLNIRASVRTDVWAMLAQYDEALDKCEQYMLDLRWSRNESGQILDNKIRSYFERTYGKVPPLAIPGRLSTLVFKEPFHWGPHRVEPYRPIHILSGGRPRWAAHLCRLAANAAHRTKSDVIRNSDVRQVLRDYGQFRIADMYKEHRHQCPQLERLIESFANGPARYKTPDLLSRITTKIIKRYGMPRIDGVPAPQGSMGIAHFIYRTGFLCARDDSDPTGLGFVTFYERPNLLSVEENPDDGLVWEIHPSYRAVLKIDE